MRILNAYAGIGGNRRLWAGHNVTAVESNPEIAAIYQALYPEDTVIVADAHEFIREHHAEFGFIWTSPPCPTHSQLRYRTQVLSGRSAEVYPDMTLYEQIVFLQYHAKPHTQWLVENVQPYYEPLVPATKLNRHLYWSNFDLPEIQPHERANLAALTVAELQELHGIDISAHAIKGKRQILRNCVAPTDGLAILTAALEARP